MFERGVLQIMRQQMEAQHTRLLSIQDAAQELSLRMSPPGGGSDLETIEALQDRWDALVMIMEMQTQRVSSSNKLTSLSVLALNSVNRNT